MNRQLFVNYIKSPEKLNAESIIQLESLVTDYPYCQTAGTLYTLNLRKENSIKYNNSLKMSAAYMADRVLLKQLLNAIHSKESNVVIETQKPVPKDELKKNIEKEGEVFDIDEMSISEMIELLKEKIQIAEQSEISPEQKENLPFIATRLNEIIDKYSSIEEPILEIPKKKIVTEYSFDHLGDVDFNNEKANRNQNLIDKFIEETPSISTPPKADFFNPVDLAKHSIIDNEEIVSETLANIYYQQGNLQKAINIYRKLSLLNPEKSTYFAALIEKIKNEVK